MAANKKTAMEYRSREELDGELNGAIGEILSAEAEARHIIERAEESVKAVQQAGATRERSMREDSARDIAARRNSATEQAARSAEAECERLIGEATARGEELIKSKKQLIEKRATELFSALGDL